MTPRLLLFFAAAALAMSACGSEPDRGETLQAAAEQTIVPTYEAFAVDAAALDLTVSELCAAPSLEGITAVNAATGDAHQSWATTEAMWIGPAMERRSWAVIDWPVAAGEIDELLADTSLSLDVDRISQRIGADQRGLGAIEHLLDVGLDGFDDPRRCDYLAAITEVIRDEADALVTDWTIDFEGGGPWADAIGTDADANVDALVNDAVFMLEATADAELGTALGVMDRDQDMEALLEGPLGFGVADITGRMSGLHALFVGTPDAPGISELLGEDLAGRLGEQIDASLASLATIEGSLHAAVVDRPADISVARDDIKVVQVTISTEVVSRLGVTIGFSDADGDTGG